MKILYVDLLYKKTEVRERNWKIGGYELAEVILREYPSAIVIAPGLLTGTSAPTGGRYTIAGKTRVRTHFGNMGGFIGSYIKGYGFSAIVFLKESDGPVVVEFSKEGVNFKNSLNILGSGTKEIFRKFEKDGKKVIAVGPAGEMGVKISSIIAEGFRAVGHGMGELFFRKGIKALIFNPAKFEFYNSVFMKRSKDIKEKLKAVEEGVEIKHPCYGCPIKCLAYEGRSKKGVSKIFKDLGISQYEVDAIVDLSNDKGVDIFGAYLAVKRYKKDLTEIINLAAEGEDFEVEYPPVEGSEWEKFLDSAGVCKYAAEYIDKEDINKLIEIYKEVAL